MSEQFKSKQSMIHGGLGWGIHLGDTITPIEEMDSDHGAGFIVRNERVGDTFFLTNKDIENLKSYKLSL